MGRQEQDGEYPHPGNQALAGDKISPREQFAQKSYTYIFRDLMQKIPNSQSDISAVSPVKSSVFGRNSL